MSMDFLSRACLESQGLSRWSLAISMQPFARSVVRGGQHVLRAFKPKIQASKPKNNLDFAADAIVVSIAIQ
jgi:hypothetical protein